MNSSSNTYQLLLAREKKLKAELTASIDTKINNFTSTAQRVFAVLLSGGLIYILTLFFLRRRTSKATKPSVKKVRSAQHWFTSLSSFALSLQRKKMTVYDFLSSLLVFFLKGQGVLLTIAPWLLKVLYDAYVRQRSRTSS